MATIKKSILIFLMAVSFSGCGKKDYLYTQIQPMMGTVVRVVSSHSEAANIVFTEIKRIENIFSSYNKLSDIYRLNKTGFLKADPEVILVIKKAKELYELTEGLFDISIGPLSKTWKKAIEAKKVPTDIEIKNALNLVGFNNIVFDKDNNITFSVKGMKIDLGAIAKGYAVDKAVKELKKRGINSALIDAGGDIYCLGAGSGKLWQIGVQHPRQRQEILSVLELQDSAVATSGDYRQFVEIEEKRYSHIINSKTGWPVTSDIISVTVIADNVMTADSVATCVFLLGKEQGLKRFKRYNGVRKIIAVTKADIQ